MPCALACGKSGGDRISEAQRRASLGQLTASTAQLHSSHPKRRACFSLQAQGASARTARVPEQQGAELGTLATGADSRSTSSPSGSACSHWLGALAFGTASRGKGHRVGRLGFAAAGSLSWGAVTLTSLTWSFRTSAISPRWGAHTGLAEPCGEMLGTYVPGALSALLWQHVLPWDWAAKTSHAGMMDAAAGLAGVVGRMTPKV